MKLRGVLIVVLGVLGVAAIPAVARADRQAVIVSASSTQKSKGDKFAPWRAVDGDKYTGWCEGAKGPGTGQTLLLHFGGPVPIRRVEIWAGVHQSDDVYQKNVQVTELSFMATSSNGGTLGSTGPAIKTIPGFEKPTVLGFKAGSSWSFQVNLAAAAPGTDRKLANGCISEIKFYGENNQEIQLLYGFDGGALMTLPMGVKSLRTALDGCDPGVLADKLQLPVEHSVMAEEDSYTTKYKNVKAFVKACKAGDVPKLPPEADKLDIEQLTPGRIRVEVQGDQMLRFEMVYLKNFWKLVWLETY